MAVIESRALIETNDCICCVDDQSAPMNCVDDQSAPMNCVDDQSAPMNCVDDQCAPMNCTPRHATKIPHTRWRASMYSGGGVCIGMVMFY